MSKGDIVIASADGLLKGGRDPRRSSARRTAWLLAALAFGFYLLFYFLGQFR